MIEDKNSTPPEAAPPLEQQASNSQTGKQNKPGILDKSGILAFLPLGIVVALAALFTGMMLSDRNPKEIRSVLIGQPVPLLPDIYLEGFPLDKSDPSKPTLINFFASWCVPCRAEHDSLVRLKNKGIVNLIGVSYQDDPEDSARFLRDLGNPYGQIILDENARLGVEFGVTGVPESYLVTPQGILSYRHWGPIVGDSLEQRVVPAIQAAVTGDRTK